MERLPHNPRNPVLLISGISGYIAIAALVNIVPPENIWMIALFICTITVSTGLVLCYLLRRRQLSIRISAAFAVFLILRLFGLRSPLYVLLLIACAVALELSMRKR